MCFTMHAAYSRCAEFCSVRTHLGCLDMLQLPCMCGLGLLLALTGQHLGHVGNL